MILAIIVVTMVEVTVVADAARVVLEAGRLENNNYYQNTAWNRALYPGRNAETVVWVVENRRKYIHYSRRK